LEVPILNAVPALVLSILTLPSFVKILHKTSLTAFNSEIIGATSNVDVLGSPEVLLMFGDTAIPSLASVIAVAPNLSVIVKGPFPGPVTPS
jgi:hypothetical protein